VEVTARVVQARVCRHVVAIVGVSVTRDVVSFVTADATLYVLSDVLLVAVMRVDQVIVAMLAWVVVAELAQIIVGVPVPRQVVQERVDLDVLHTVLLQAVWVLAELTARVFVLQLLALELVEPLVLLVHPIALVVVLQFLVQMFAIRVVRPLVKETAIILVPHLVIQDVLTQPAMVLMQDHSDDQTYLQLRRLQPYIQYY
jgi:hypothetical protein